MSIINQKSHNYVNPAAMLDAIPISVSTSYSGVALNNTTYSDATANYMISGFQNGETIARAGITLSGSMAFNGSTATSVKNGRTYTQTAGTLAMHSTATN